MLYPLSQGTEVLATVSTLRLPLHTLYHRLQTGHQTDRYIGRSAIENAPSLLPLSLTGTVSGKHFAQAGKEAIQSSESFFSIRHQSPWRNCQIRMYPCRGLPE